MPVVCNQKTKEKGTNVVQVLSKPTAISPNVSGNWATGFSGVVVKPKGAITPQSTPRTGLIGVKVAFAENRQPHRAQSPTAGIRDGDDSLSAFMAASATKSSANLPKVTLQAPATALPKPAAAVPAGSAVIKYGVFNSAKPPIKCDIDGVGVFSTNLNRQRIIAQAAASLLKSAPNSATGAVVLTDVDGGMDLNITAVPALASTTDVDTSSASDSSAGSSKGW